MAIELHDWLKIHKRVAVLCCFAGSRQSRLAHG